MAVRRLLVAVGIVLLLGPPGVGAGVARAQTGAPRRMTLVAQSPFVPAGGEFSVRVKIDRATVPSGSELALTVYRPVQTRSEFAQTLEDRIGRGVALGPITAPATPDSNGEVTVRVPADLGGDDGVFPVRVDLRDRAGILERFTTHLVYLTGSHGGPKLGLSLVLPVQGALSLPPDGPRQLNDLDDVATSASALEANRSLPFVLEPAPETLAALEASRDDKAARALDSLRRLAADHTLVARPYVPLSLPALVQEGLPGEVQTQVGRGTAAVGEALGSLGYRLDTKTWVETEPLDPESIDLLIRRGVERIVVAEPVLEPVPDLTVTLSRPFVLAGREEDAPAVAADAALSARFNGAPNQVLEAHHLLADLAVLWLDAPASDRRAVVAVAPPGWRATRAFLDALAGGLSQHPVVEPVPLDTVFNAVTPATTARGLTLVRHPAPVPAGALADVAAEVRTVRQRLTSLETILSAPAPTMQLLGERLLIAESSQLPNTAARKAYVGAVEAGIADQLKAIEMPTGRSITLTARRGQIPVTFQNRTGTPAKVLVTVQSDKLEFPEGTTRPLDLSRRNTTERFEVVARTSGAFPLRITLHSPDGNLLIGQARLTVRSTAASRVSVFVSVSAVFFLAVWWGRHIVRGRRAGRLVPA